MNERSRSWTVKARRVHGRLAIVYYPAGTNPAGITHPIKKEITLTYPKGAARIQALRGSQVKLDVSVNNPKDAQKTTHQFDQDDWQGILEGFYEPTARINVRGSTQVWFGHHCINRGKRSDEGWQMFCENLGNVFQNLRWDREKIRQLLPIGRFWGLLTAREYLYIRWQLMTRQTVTTPFGEQLKNGEDFGYQILQSPNKSWNDLSSQTREWWNQRHPKKK